MFLLKSIALALFTLSLVKADSLAKAEPFRSHWEGKIETFVVNQAPNHFQSGQDAILNVRQLRFEGMEWNPLIINQDFKYTTFHLLLAAAQNNSTLDMSGNCAMMPRGIAATCDWALLVPCFYGNLSRAPRTVFVHHLMLAHFVKIILPTISREFKFVLVTSGTDQTIPTGRGDTRFQTLDGFADSDDGGPLWQMLTSHPQILHWYCENHDLRHENVSTLPLGVVEGVRGMNHIGVASRWIPLEKRPIKFLVAHRTRTGTGQWETRANVSRLCTAQQLLYSRRYALCVSPPAVIRRDYRQGIPQYLYVALAQRVSFVACVHGGGIDPSPKAWEALMLGTIPIIQHSTLDDAYSNLPVAFVNDWNDLFGDIDQVHQKLQTLHAVLSPYYTDPVLRQSVLQRLKTNFWRDKILNTYATKKKQFS